MKRPRIAVIGAGHLGRIHARLLNERDDAELIGLVDPDESARVFASDVLGVPYFASLDEVLARCDAAIVAAPTTLHHRIGTELISCGKHVLMEKPLTETSAQADELVFHAERNHVVLQVGHVERFNPAWRSITARLRNLRYISACRTGGFTFRCLDVGVVLDLMIHDLDLVLTAVQSPLAEVSACGMAVMGGHEDIASARLLFENGCTADLNASRISTESIRQMHAWTAHGFARLDFALHSAVWIGMRDDVASGRFDARTVPAVQWDCYREQFFSDLLPLQKLSTEPVNAIAEEQTDFLNCITTGSTPSVTGQQGRDTILIAEQIVAAIANSQPASKTLPPVVPMIAHTGEQRSIARRREAG